MSSSGQTKFAGSTVNAELMQLLNSVGDYRYLLNPDSARKLHSIFDLKKKQGYSTSAIHSFSGKMFQRNIWWKNIGIESVFFLDEVVHKEKLTSSQMNYSTPFPSLNDEDAFLFISCVQDKKKKFSYFLTVNTHLPNRARVSNENLFIDWSDLQMSDDVQNQLNRIVELITFFAKEGEKENWSKIFIVGDHMPPFSKEGDRNFYSKKEVPHLTLSR